jgi:hypothetical protein
LEFLFLQSILQVLDVPPRIPIRVLAPYLDADNPQLRESVRLWFRLHDTAGTDNGGTPPIKPVNYEDYLEYVESMLAHKEDVPPPFIKYIFNSSPGRALLVFAYANSGKVQRHEIELAEHIVSNAIWLNKNGFTDRFQAALPETNEQLAKLAKGEWWAKLYVIYVMRQNPILLKAQTLRQLEDDSNELVRGAAKSVGS